MLKFLISAVVCFLSAFSLTGAQLLIDCYPEDGSSQAGCESRGCIWATQSVAGAPFCTFPDGYGYAIVGQETDTALGFELPLQIKAGQTTPYGGDIANVRLTVEYWSQSILRIKFDDPNNARYEVPVPLYGRPTSKAAQTDYTVTYTDSPQFGIFVTRNSDGAIVFDTRAPGFMFADQYLQTTTALPSSNLYGFGENRHRNFLLETDYQLWTMFAREKQPIQNGNLYGVHPFYLNVENTGNANGVFFFNSNAMEVALLPYPAVTFRSIGGVLDFYIFLGPTPEDVARQYHSLIGNPTMPSYWYLGYMLSRYGYTSTDEIRNVTQSMLDNQIPYDVQFTDIDAYDAFLDFTANPNGFSDLAAWTDELHAQGIRYIPIVDAAIGDSRPGNYKPLDDGVAMDIFVKNPDGSILEGNVWPGNTYFPDFSHPDGPAYWSLQHQYYYNTVGVHFDGIWIDMNEPSNFVEGSTSGCDNGKYDFPPYPTHINGANNGIFEETICMESEQAAGLHYNVHSLYSYYNAIATYKALQDVFPGKRPNIVSRSTYAGSGVYTTHWLGDNNSDWGEMHDSVTGMLEFNLFGIPVVGADVCGFGGTTTLEMCIRWTQLGAFYPFCRNHNLIGSPPQDPPSLGPEMVQAAKAVLTERYRLLPFLYSLIHDVHVGKAGTVARSLVQEFPQDANTRAISFQFLWGSALSITPVLDEGATSVGVYFPNDRWFDYYTGAEVTTVGTTVTVDAPLDGPIPLHIRGGYVIPTQEPSVTTDISRTNPFGLIVALDGNGAAQGSLFWDDGETAGTDESGAYNQFSFSHNLNTLTITASHRGYNAQTQPLNTIKYLGVSQQPASVTVDGTAISTGISYDSTNKVLNLSDLNLSYLTDHTIVLG